MDENCFYIYFRVGVCFEEMSFNIQQLFWGEISILALTSKENPFAQRSNKIFYCFNNILRRGRSLRFESIPFLRYKNKFVVMNALQASNPRF